MIQASNDVLGIGFGLATAGLWSATAMIFEAASRRLGSLRLNLVRLVFALVFFAALSLVRFGRPLPAGLDPDNWLWLGASGLVGFVIGDLCLFEAFVLIGSTLSMLVYSSVPFATALLGWLILGETMSASGFWGMGLCVAGIALAIWRPAPGETEPGTKTAGLPGSTRIPGILLALAASVAQALGLILSRRGQGDLDPFSATQLRVMPAIVGFGLLWLTTALLRPASGLLKGRLRDAKGQGLALGGALIGPFLGVSLGLLSAQYIGTGLASTLMALVPIYMVLAGFFIPGRRPSLREVAGALLAVAGVAVISL